METATFANRKLRLAVLLYILRRKRHRSIQRKKLYFNTDVKCITKHQYSSDLWPLKIKRNCIVRQIARSTFC
jgi:ankyrin repeat protein